MMKELKKALEALEMAEKATEAADKAWDLDVDNEALEAAYDRANEEEYRIFDRFTKELAKLTGMSLADARFLVINGREQVKSILARAM